MRAFIIFVVGVLCLSSPVFSADTKPIVQNPNGGTQVLQAGQTLFCPLTSGAFSAIPAAATSNTAQVYWATDTQTLYRSNGTSWVALSGGGTPGGNAGGDLSGTYPNPTVAAIKGTAVPSLVNGAFLKLTSGGSWEFVSYGTAADTPAAGNDLRFTNSRAPNGSASGDLGSTYPAPTVTGIQGISVPTPVSGQFLKQSAGGAWEFVPYGTGSDTPAAGNDSRFTNSRAPNGSASGDLSGTYPGPTVASINGTALGTIATTAGTLLGGNGTAVKSLTISGDATVSSSGVIALKNTGTAGTYQSVTTDAQGRVTAGTNPTTLSGYGITDAVANAGTTPSIASGVLSSRPSASIAGRLYIATDTGALYRDTGSAWTLLLPALSGDVSTSGTTATLGASGVTAGTYGSATQAPVVVVDAKGRITSASNATITPAASNLSGIVALANGGTGSNLSSTGGSGKVLKQTSSGGNVSVANIVNADLPTSGISAGTYQSVTVNAQGITTGGTNPTTLSGYNITDGLQNTGGVPSLSAGLDASKPSASVSGRIYFATDTQKIYEDTGSAWQLMLPALTGDVTTSGVAATLAASGVSAASYGSTTAIPVVTFDTKGRATSATTAAIAAPASGITGTLSVAHGGTGVTSATPYAILAGGTTSTGAVQSLAGLGTAGQILTSNGASALPTFQTLTAGSIGGTAALGQVAVGTGTNTIGGGTNLTFSSGLLTQTNTAEILQSTSASQSHTAYYSTSVPAYAFASGLTTPGGAMSDTFKISSFINSSLAWGPIFTIDPNGNAVAAATITGTALSATASTASSSTSTGAIIDAGGLGVAGAEFLGGSLNATATTASTSTTSGSIINSGGEGIAGAEFVGGTINAVGTTASTSPTTGNIINSGGEGIAGAEYVGGLIHSAGIVTGAGLAASATTVSTGVTSGAVIDNGGLGVAGAEFLGGALNVASTTASVGVGSGAIVDAGGLGVAGVESLGGTFVAYGTTASSSPTTGNIIDDGGLGVAGAEYVGGLINSASTITGTVLTSTATTASTSTTTGSVIDAGGLGVAGASYFGGIANIQNGTASTGTGSGALTVAGGVGVIGAEFLGGALNVASTTASTGTTNGAIVDAGGLGVAGAEWLGGLLNVAGSTTVQGVLTAGGSTAPAANTFSGNVIWGGNNGASYTPGAAGEFIESQISTAVNAAASGVYLNLATINLTAGNWIVSGSGYTTPNGATYTPPALNQLGISLNSASSTGTILGYSRNRADTVLNAGNTVFISMPAVHMAITASGNTPVYLIAYSSYTTGTPQWTGSLSATRAP